jgi:hypothetical protein
MKKIVCSLTLVMAALFSQAQPPKVPAEPGTVFGEKTVNENTITVSDLVSQMKASEKPAPREVNLVGKVTEVCQKEGCWIRVASPDGNMMVKMKDHKFLVPVILHGKSIVIKGTAEMKVTPVEELQHLAEDAGKTKEEIAKITTPKKEITVQAKGILVL